MRRFPWATIVGGLLLTACGTTQQAQFNSPSTRSSSSNSARTPTTSPTTTIHAMPTPRATSTPTASAPTTDTLRGTIKNGQLQTVVWVGLSPQGPLYPVSLMLDTGAEHTMVSGNFFKAAGDTPTGQTTTYAGIGGNEQVGFWPNVWVFPQDRPVDPIIAGQTEPGGLNRSMLGSESIIVLLGQDVIQTGQLTQKGMAWTLQYPVFRR